MSARWAVSVAAVALLAAGCGGSSAGRDRSTSRDAGASASSTPSGSGSSSTGTASASSAAAHCPAHASGTSGGRLNQAIWFPPLGEQHEWPDSAAPLRACSSSGLPISYRILVDDSTANCQLAPPVHPVRVVGVETVAQCRIAADQPGDGRYAPAAEVVRGYTMNSLHVRLTATGPGPAARVSHSPTQVLVTLTATWPAGPVQLLVEHDDLTDWCTPPAVVNVDMARSSQVVPITVALHRPDGSAASGSCGMSISLQDSQNMTGGLPVPLSFPVQP